MCLEDIEDLVSGGGVFNLVSLVDRGCDLAVKRAVREWRASVAKIRDAGGTRRPDRMSSMARSRNQKISWTCLGPSVTVSCLLGQR